MGLARVCTGWGGSRTETVQRGGNRGAFQHPWGQAALWSLRSLLSQCWDVLSFPPWVGGQNPSTTEGHLAMASPSHLHSPVTCTIWQPPHHSSFKPGLKRPLSKSARSKVVLSSSLRFLHSGPLPLSGRESSPSSAFSCVRPLRALVSSSLR